MYQALYRKWRPQTFDQVVGQQHITETLKNQVRTGRLSHAYLFIGTRGTGKTTCARILAKAVNCEHPVDGNPCGVCPACRGISDGSVLDVVELDAASNNGVDNVRALREEAVFTPASVRKRVYIIDEVHMLSASAFNALLKILEEPPEHLMFILATTELQKVPATILSRCQRHSFRRIDTPDIAEYLEYIAKQENFKLSHEAAELIARLADGGVRDALSLLDQCSASETIDLEAVYSAMGLAGNRRTAQLMSGILDHDTDKTLRDFNAMWMDGKDPATLLTELSGLLRDTLMTHVAPKGARSLISGGYDDTTLGELSGRMTTEEIICAMETVQKYTASMRESTSPKTTAELCLVSLCDNTMGESIAELRARISRLELQISSGSFTPVREDKHPTPAPAEEEPERYEPELPQRREETYISEEDDLDPEMFMEEQPEDSFVQRGGRVEPEPQAEPEAQPKADAPAGEPTWKDICAKAAGSLPMDIKLRLDDSASVRGKIENGTLRIEVVPGFLYGRFNRQDVLAKFSEAATALAGKEIHALLSELHDEPRPQRSLDELKQFKEVKFI
ncbi:MAG: DNA polymerase III subunit gamma/tau [Candidatus Limivicinus sp.]|nr:DNA polymerase III subunit gamma/tau [Candidatus Limivicinus sp.]